MDPLAGAAAAGTTAALRDGWGIAAADAGAAAALRDARGSAEAAIAGSGKL